jgi:hypothetical protein
MGASLTMIDRHYGHLAKDGRQHAINLLDSQSAAETRTDVQRWARSGRAGRVHPRRASRNTGLSRTNAQALCRTRTDDPFLTMEGCSRNERSLGVTNGH